MQGPITQPGTQIEASLSVRVPGKLLLAGEYAILEPGALALVMGVNRYFYGHLKIQQRGFVLTSAQFPDLVMRGKRLEAISDATAPEPLRFAAAAWQEVALYLRNVQHEQRGFKTNAVAPAGQPWGLHLHLDSQLQVDAVKLGLGSSAACCVAVVAALCKVYLPDLEEAALRRLIFQLAFLAHHRVQGSGSGADVAGCVYGSLVAYRRPELSGVASLYQEDWPQLMLERSPWPADAAWQLAFGWTRSSASSKVLVADFEAWRQAQPKAAEEFLAQMQDATQRLYASVQAQDLSPFCAAMSAQRQRLARLNEVMHHAPETPALTQLIEAAEALGGSAKFSGAGGGDCGLAWVPAAQRDALKARWQAAGILPLDLKQDAEGTVFLMDTAIALTDTVTS